MGISDSVETPYLGVHETGSSSDIETFRTSINIDLTDLASWKFSSEERKGIQVHLQWRLEQLPKFISALERLDSTDDA